MLATEAVRSKQNIFDRTDPEHALRRLIGNLLPFAANARRNSKKAGRDADKNFVWE